MSLGKALIVVGLGIAGYLLYTKFATQKQSLPQTQEQANATQVSNLGLDPVKGVESVVVSALGGASVPDYVVKDFVNTHNYGAFTKYAISQNQTTIVPQFRSRAEADAYHATHKTAYG